MDETRKSVSTTSVARAKAPVRKPIRQPPRKEEKGSIWEDVYEELAVSGTAGMIKKEDENITAIKGQAKETVVTPIVKRPRITPQLPIGVEGPLLAPSDP